MSFVNQGDESMKLFNIPQETIWRLNEIVNPRTPVGEAEVKDVAHAVLLLSESLNRLQDHLAEAIDAALAEQDECVAG